MAINVNTTVLDADAAAAKWLARRDRGLTAAEKAAFAEWLASPAHAEAFRRAEAFWEALPKLNRLPAADLFWLAEPRRRRLAPSVWLAAGMAAAAAVALFFTVGNPAAAPAPAAVVCVREAPADAEARFVLPDGSIAVLHRGSRIFYGDFADSRQVRLLSGEAHFTVAKDSPRPFFVRAGQVIIRDIGTAFHVRLDSERVAVLVTEGKVEVRNDAASARTAAGVAPEPVLLSMGQQAVVETSTAGMRIGVPTVPEVQQTLGWKSRRLSFDRTPLSRAVTEINRYNVRQISIADSDIATMLVAGGVQSDNIDAFVRVLETSFGITAETQGNEIVLHKVR
jgi:transmembrane sensor